MKYSLPLLLFALLAVTGCTHDPSVPIAGKGGNARLIIYPQHHGQTASLYDMKVYIKYEATDVPAGDKYDDSATCVIVNSQPTCTFGNLWNGNYYLYCKGFDANLLPPGGVKGGLKYTIKSQQAISINLPVGEE